MFYLGIDAFNTQLEAVNLSELLVDENNSDLNIDWNERV